tara:strand:+ start:292 stop:447 length:156 start_codon:yes stop_codon:yes gene_type:complete
MASLVYRGREYTQSKLSEVHKKELEKRQGVPMSYRNSPYYRSKTQSKEEVV